MNDLSVKTGAPPSGGTASPVLSAEVLRDAIVNKLTYAVGKDVRHALDHDWLIATAMAVRDQIVDRWMDATRKTHRNGKKKTPFSETS